MIDLFGRHMCLVCKKECDWRGIAGTLSSGFYDTTGVNSELIAKKRLNITEGTKIQFDVITTCHSSGTKVKFEELAKA
ncbi:hypothetical protein ACJDU8_18900 [Clostridium sp. WILCCON 0269]|uniref:Uncharacterized protein n=1 Tax=Candidatus Clostridium eludens TaxID=3381663 RepID=A0ABW8SNG5_9CLOT